MIDFSFFKARPIGLDIGHSSVKMLQFASKDGQIYVVGGNKIQCKTESSDWQVRKDFLVSAITELTNRCGFSGRKVVSCLPNDRIQTGSFRFDVSESDHVDALVKSEVSERFGLDPDRDEIDYVTAGKVYQGEEIKNEVIYFATSRSTIEDHISVLEESGLIPVSIDPIAFALMRNYRRAMRRQADQEVVKFIVDIGSYSTTVVVGSCQRISFIKQIPIGGSQLNGQVAKRLNISIEEAALLRSKMLNGNKETIDPSTERSVTDSMNEVIEKLAKEISLCFRYYSVTFRGARPTEAILSGGESYETNLVKALTRHLGIDVRQSEPLKGIDLTKIEHLIDSSSPLSEWAVATGLGIRGWDMVNSEMQANERN
ncbi:MAG: hypothetical protein FVQ79_03130 [Planctomycetes bacterium]|nr:hypothetical protein [Planctomycetota bacterium]